MTTRSALLVSSGQPNGTFAFTGPPVGVTWLVKNLIITNENGGGGNIEAFLTDAAQTWHGSLIYAAIGATSRLEWNGYQVMIPGDQLIIISGVAGIIHVRMAGTKLPGVAP